MRGLFITGAKVIGILVIYGVIQSFYSIGWTISAIRKGLLIPNLDMLLGIYAQVTISLVLGFILLFRTQKLADFLKVKEDVCKEIKLPTGEIARIGIIFIGVFFLGNAIPQLCKTLYLLSKYSGFSSWNEDTKITSELISSVLKAGLGAWLISSSKKLAAKTVKQ